MSRRSSRKVANLPSYTETGENETLTSAVKVEQTTPKKTRIVPVNELTEVTTNPTNRSISKTGAPKKAQKELKVEQIAAESLEAPADIKISPSKQKLQPVQSGGPDKKVEVSLSEEVLGSPKKVKGKRRLKTEEDADIGDENKTLAKKRKTKGEKEAEAMPLATRTTVSTLKKAMYIGAHVSGAGGVHNSINNALHIGGNAFALFLKSQRKWASPPLADEARDQFHAFSKEHNYDVTKHVLPHGSYLVNLAQPDPEKAEQAYICFLDDLKRCEALGIKLYNFHPGNTGPNPRPQAIARIAANLNKAHKATKTVVTVLENMAGSGNVIGSTFEDLRDIIALLDDKSRVGVCIDTCHSFAAGYDLRSPEAFAKTMKSFSDIVGIKYLKALHLNDSKAPFSSHRDLHANIGTGFLGLRAFHNIVNYEPFQNLPMVLETPIDRKGEDGKVVEDKSVWAKEIKLLEGLIGADAESREFVDEEQRLQDVGAEERGKFQQQADKKVQKTIDSMFKGTKGKAKNKKSGAKEDDSGTESEGGCNH